MSENNILERKEQLRKLTDKYPSTDNETVYGQALRYGKIAHEAYCRVMNTDWILDPRFDGLTKVEQQAWIEVAMQIERAVLKDQND